MTGEPPQIVEACESCGNLLDVTGLQPLAEVLCPHCEAQTRARRTIDHFELLELIGQGGMGSVFKAIDKNLNREVALKLLRSATENDPEEKTKLAEEARRAATINHPNVAKVFSFGESNGQLYLSMELLEKGSLDDLMEFQSKVPEIQVLEVGIQIAGGLQAALEAGMIHRDIKPGNILFADAHQAKLVDFGLARVMDEVAAEKGEIWGTPYYVAPEKLDNGEEDFRSDIYSLGGTLFHALAGRPPYEAESASMVALKQLKSQPVSLQSFAPDVSSETSFVINRMMAKNQLDRYQDYDELISHLAYAKDKLLEKIQRQETRRRTSIEVESRHSKVLIGGITLVLLLFLVGLGIFGYVQRETLAEVLGLQAANSERQWTSSSIRSAMAEVGGLVAANQLQEALGTLQSITDTAAAPQPAKNEARLALQTVLLFEGKRDEARKAAASLQADGLFSHDPELLLVANFFPEIGRFTARTGPAPAANAEGFDPKTFEAFAILLFSAHNAAVGDPASALRLTERFLAATPEGNAAWISNWRPAATNLLPDLRKARDLQSEISEATTPEAKTKARESAARLAETLNYPLLFQPWIESLEQQLR